MGIVQPSGGDVPYGCVVLIGPWQSLGSAALNVRFDVFVREQKVPLDIEHDEADLSALHVLIKDKDGRALGTGRLLPDGHIGRIAVLMACRRRGIGSLIVRQLLAAARRAGHREAALNAPLDAQRFYQRLGFREEGAPFMEAGIAHIAMRVALTD